MLFENQFKVDNSPKDNTSIRQVLLYYNDPAAKEFKELCKKGMMQMYPETFRDANISDFILDLLKQKYGASKVDS